ncbi:hypothetical protein CWI75_07200 [Kineobactrum sediminis]|uniref:Uncharacterized protein n=1 Tax=Kineobactrum sediminis TaxID=1905677 RepID=A0A2N5Y466_9GAMM|nr:hypothetical protein CWI75_07200 [Kineobactrum sediminis]
MTRGSKAIPRLTDNVESQATMGALGAAMGALGGILSKSVPLESPRQPVKMKVKPINQTAADRMFNSGTQ